MAAWLGPALKAVLPHIGTIVSAVQPIFTRKKADAAANQVQLLQEQIAELQTAASHNAEHIKDLAAQLQSTLLALEEAASIAESNIKKAFLLSAAAAVISVISIVMAAFALYL